MNVSKFKAGLEPSSGLQQMHAWHYGGGWIDLDPVLRRNAIKVLITVSILGKNPVVSQSALQFVKTVLVQCTYVLLGENK